MPKGKGLTKRYRFSEEELKVVPKKKGLDKIYRFSQEELKVVPKEKGLTKRVKSCAQKKRLSQEI